MTAIGPGQDVADQLARWATIDDGPALRAVIDLSINTLQTAFLSPEQVAASHAVMGLDVQLIRDGTYLVVERRRRIIGCGGWSRRATLFGGEHAAALRDGRLLDPSREPARIRAMYTHPDFVRQGVARLVLSTCERAAASEGFRVVELMATLSGGPLYAATGYVAVERVDAPAEGLTVPLVRMRKQIG